MYAGAEISFGGWIFSYAVATGVADEVTAAYLTSAFWAAFTAGRLISIPLAARFRARALMTVDLLGCLVSVGVMIVWPQSVTAVWLGTMGLGLSFASLFPTTLILAERHLHVQGKTTSYFFMGASLGAMTIPWFIGQRFEAVGPQATVGVTVGWGMTAVDVIVGNAAGVLVGRVVAVGETAIGSGSGVVAAWQAPSRRNHVRKIQLSRGCRLTPPSYSPSNDPPTQPAGENCLHIPDAVV